MLRSAEISALLNHKKRNSVPNVATALKTMTKQHFCLLPGKHTVAPAFAPVVTDVSNYGNRGSCTVANSFKREQSDVCTLSKNASAIFT